MPSGGRGDRLLGYCGRGSVSGAKTDRAKLHSKLPAPGCCFPDSLRRYFITRAGSGLWPVVHVIIRFITCIAGRNRKPRRHKNWQRGESGRQHLSGGDEIPLDEVERIAI